MATRTVDEGFRCFLGRLTPYETETSKAASHRRSIEACLKRKYTLQRFWRTGSFGNGTSISGYSDVDYFASVSSDHLKKDSNSSLRDMKEQLRGGFPSTPVNVSCPAVVVDFGTSDWETHEVVPAFYVEKKGTHSVYGIPNCSGGWMKASPDAHKAYVKKIDYKLGGKARALIRFIKAWKYYRNVPISSFYLELRIAEYARGEDSIVYSIDVKRALAHLRNKKLASIRDPMGVSGNIPACKTELKRRDALSKLDTAYTRATKAVQAEHDEKIKHTFAMWNLLFDGHFPSYYK